MATDSLRQNIKTQTSTSSLTDVVHSILAPLASLKLTVFLLVLSIGVTLVATLDQTRADVYVVKMKHFHSVFVEVPFQTFFVPVWAPNYQNVPGSIYIPSGLTVLVMMLLNVTAAHLLRFRLQASGAKLVVGSLVAIFAAGLTWAVIFNGQGADGFQSQPMFSWTQMWMMLQAGLLALVVGSVVSFFTVGKSKKTERLLLGLSTLICGAILGVTLFLGEEAFIGNSAMRILWQLMQATIAALVAYFACMILFRRKSGIVLLHLGIAGLMLNEIYVTATNDEQRMTIFEGETVSQTVDIRAVEMAIIDTSDPEFDEIVAIPGAKLESEKTISNGNIPFDVRAVKFMPNSDLRRRTGGGEPNLATAGIGLRLEALDLMQSTGADADQSVDFASAYVELKDKSNGSSLGTYLITQNLDETSSDTVTIGDKSWRINLRFKTHYKPYSMMLKEAKRENYPGTQTPRSYSSEVVLDDAETGVKSDQLIWMNNPLRYSGETFYQSGMDTLSNGKTYTVLQVVRNNGWMIPYVCCMFTVVGLLAQFGSSLLGFLEKTRAKEKREREAKSKLEILAGGEPGNGRLATGLWAMLGMSSGRWKGQIAVAVLTGFFGLWASGEAMKSGYRQVVKNDMRLDLFGQIPITINGRVEPLDSFARNTARQLSKREMVFDGYDKKQPAIRWLADTMFEVDGFEEYRTFRIEDKNILGALDFPETFADPRGNFRYTLGEMLGAERELRNLIPDPSQSDPKTWTTFQKRLNVVAQQLQRVYGLKLAFGGPDNVEDDLLVRIEKSGKIPNSPLFPLIVPSTDPDQQWQSFAAVKNRIWLVELANEYESKTTATLARAIIDIDIVPTLRERMIRQRIIERFLANPEFIASMEQQFGESDPVVLAQILEQRWEQFPAEQKAELVTSEGPLVDASIAQQMPRYESVMESQLAAINGSSGEISESDLELANLLSELGPAYVASDAEKFNSTLETYLAQVNSTPLRGMKPFRLSVERFYNGFAPFYVAMIIYIVAFLVSIFGWVGWRKSWNRAATGLLVLGVLIHVGGLVARVIISGRPPVTNLYSSVLFVSAAMVVLMLIVERVTKLGIGNTVAALGAFLALLWAWTMTIVDGDTFTVMVAVLDTQFWLATHVVCISIGYAATFGAGLLGLAYIVGSLLSSKFKLKAERRKFGGVIYGVVCFGLLCSFFGTVLGGLWGDDSWGRFWGWDPKENGALMIVLWNAVVLHARWAGLVRERGLASLAVLGNVVVLWSWKGVNAMGVGLHAYAGTEDDMLRKILAVAAVHVLVAACVIIPARFWMSYAVDKTAKL